MKQRTWDEHGTQADRAAVGNRATGDLDRTRLTAVSAQHSGEWLHARPISSCGLRLDNEAIRVAVGLRLSADLSFTLTSMRCSRLYVTTQERCVMSKNASQKMTPLRLQFR